MKIITVFLPEEYIKALEGLVSEGRFPNRSEAIRVAIRELVLEENAFITKTSEASK